jgi:hypothetical protein
VTAIVTTSSPYVDVLGAISNARTMFGPLQVAVGLRPRTPRAGRKFDILVLMQNTLDVPVDAIVSLHLPRVDAKGQKDQFTASKTRILIGLRPAETGVASLPAMAYASAAPGDSARFAVEIRTEVLGKGNVVRPDSGMPPLDPAQLPDAVRADLTHLRSATWSAQKSRLQPVVEVPLPLLPGSVNTLTTGFRAGWTSLWTPATTTDPRPLLMLHGTRMLLETLPHLRRLETYVPLLNATFEHFRNAGTALFEPEAALIAKLLTLVLEYASPEESGHGYQQAGPFAITPLLKRPPSTSLVPRLPRWAHDMLRAIDADPAHAANPVRLLTGPLFPALIEDAARFAFPLVIRETGQDLGSQAEQDDYARDLATLVAGKGDPGEYIDFTRIYLPLVMGGLFISHLMPISTEDPQTLLQSLMRVVSTRSATLTEESRPLVSLVYVVAQRVHERYGLSPESNQ